MGIPVTDARQLVQRVESLSQRQCEAQLLAISPEALPRVRDRVVSGESDHELRVIVSAQVHQRLQQIKGLLAHARAEATYAELLEYMADLTLRQLQKQKGIPSEMPKRTATKVCAPAAATTAQSDPSSTAAAAATSRNLPSGIRVYLPAALRRAVFNRALGQCEIRAADGRRCTSQYRLEIDHIHLLARGGSNDFENLRIACRVHNQQQAELKLRRSHR